MFAPTSTITVTGWMLQSVSVSKQRQRAQALTSKGNEHAHALWGEQTNETANFTLGGAYTGNVNLPTLGDGIVEWTLTYSETEFPKLDVTKNSAAGGGTWTCPLTLPARTIGCPTTIGGVTATGKTLPACKTITIHAACQHAEETDGTGTYGTLHGMRDVTVTITLTGIDGKPTLTAGTLAAGWESPSEQSGDSNTAIGSGSIVFEKHYPIGTDADADNSSGGGSGGGGTGGDDD